MVNKEAWQVLDWVAQDMIMPLTTYAIQRISLADLNFRLRKYRFPRQFSHFLRYVHASAHCRCFRGWWGEVLSMWRCVINESTAVIQWLIVWMFQLCFNYAAIPREGMKYSGLNADMSSGRVVPKDTCVKWNVLSSVGDCRDAADQDQSSHHLQSRWLVTGIKRSIRSVNWDSLWCWGSLNQGKISGVRHRRETLERRAEPRKTTLLGGCSYESTAVCGRLVQPGRDLVTRQLLRDVCRIWGKTRAEPLD